MPVTSCRIVLEVTLTDIIHLMIYDKVDMIIMIYQHKK
jgi:hypothetical protein